MAHEKVDTIHQKAEHHAAAVADIKQVLCRKVVLNQGVFLLFETFVHGKVHSM